VGRRLLTDGRAIAGALTTFRRSPVGNSGGPRGLTLDKGAYRPQMPRTEDAVGVWPVFSWPNTSPVGLVDKTVVSLAWSIAP
jgi:hypothetical protein